MLFHRYRNDLFIQMEADRIDPPAQTNLAMRFAPSSIRSFQATLRDPILHRRPAGC